jgi:LPS sulfotransferase NodH
MNSLQAYLLCGTPRTGSTLLCDLLRSTGVAGRPESFFRAPDEQAWANRWRLRQTCSGGLDCGEYVRVAVAAGSTSNGVFAARVMWGTLDEIVTKLGGVYPDLSGQDLLLLTRAFRQLRFVYLVRDDTVAQAVSWARAEQTHFWQEGDRALPGVKPHFDFDQIHDLVRTIQAHNAAWQDWFRASGVQPHLVRYEHLVREPSRCTRQILDFLGLQPASECVIRSDRRRQADRLNADWISRYRQMTAGRAPRP